MAFIEWNENELVNVTEIDNQHKEIIGLINELHEISEQKKPQDYVLMHIQDILSKSNFHFNTEESLMQKHNFMNYYSHKIEHDRFIRKMKEFMESDEPAEKSHIFDLLIFLKNWFKNHNEMKDKNMGSFLNEHGIK